MDASVDDVALRRPAGEAQSTGNDAADTTNDTTTTTSSSSSSSNPPSSDDTPHGATALSEQPALPPAAEAERREREGNNDASGDGDGYDDGDGDGDGDGDVFLGFVPSGAECQLREAALAHEDFRVFDQTEQNALSGSESFQDSAFTSASASSSASASVPASLSASRSASARASSPSLQVATDSTGGMHPETAIAFTDGSAVELCCFDPLDSGGEDTPSQHNIQATATPLRGSIELPIDLALYPEVLKQVLSWEVWMTVLTEAERSSLIRKHLPQDLLSSDDSTGTAAEHILRPVFDGENIFHGNPVERLMWMISTGVARTDVAAARRKHRWAERRRFDRLVMQRTQTQLRRCVAARVNRRIRPHYTEFSTFAEFPSTEIEPSPTVSITSSVDHESLEIESDEVTDDDSDSAPWLVDTTALDLKYDSALGGLPMTEVEGPDTTSVSPQANIGDQQSDEDQQLDQFGRAQLQYSRLQRSDNTRSYFSFASLQDLLKLPDAADSIARIPSGFRTAIISGGMAADTDGIVQLGESRFVASPPLLLSGSSGVSAPRPKTSTSARETGEMHVAVASSSVPRRARHPPHQNNTLPLIFTLFRTIRDACGYNGIPSDRPSSPVASFSKILAAVKTEQAWLFERYLCKSDFDNSEDFVALVLEYLHHHPGSPPTKRSGRIVYADPLLSKFGSARNSEDQLYKWDGVDDLSGDRALQSQEQLFWFGLSRASEKTLDVVNNTLAMRTQKFSAGISQSEPAAVAVFRDQEWQRYDSGGAPSSDKPFVYKLARPVRAVEDADWPDVPGYQGPATVAVHPLQKGSVTRPREHLALVSTRPFEVSVLCLVRDAAARLPGSLGTRPDVATLLRDSQYVKPETSDEQLNQVVSGALDRLHSQPDPCVSFDPEQKIWVFIHRNRTQENWDQAVAEAELHTAPPRSRTRKKRLSSSAEQQRKPPKRAKIDDMSDAEDERLLSEDIVIDSDSDTS